MRNDARTLTRARLALGLVLLWNARKQELVAMLRSVGVDPRHVPVDADFSRKGDLVRFDKYVLADDGCLLVGPDGRLPLTEEVSIRPSAHLVPDWIPLDRH